MAHQDQLGEKLRMGWILWQTLVLYSRRFHWFLALAWMPLVATKLFLYLVGGEAALEDYEEWILVGDSAWWRYAMTELALGVSTALTAGLMVSVSSGGPLEPLERPLTHLVRAVWHLPTLLIVWMSCQVLLTVGTIGMGPENVEPEGWFVLGFVLLTFLGVIAAVIFLVLVPVIIIEGAGFASVARLATLTHGYRWPVAGILLLVGAVTSTLNFLTWSPIEEAVFASSWFLVVVVSAGFEAAFTGVAYCCSTLVYLRLREMEGGPRLEHVSDVFE